MDYQIIPTLGPATNTPQAWQALLDAGASAFRLNTSHLSLEQLAGWLELLDDFQESQPAPVEVVLDLQGSKWRLGQFEPTRLEEGQRVRLIYTAQATVTGTLPVPHGDFFRALEESDGHIVLNDAKILLALEQSHPQLAVARVVRGGPISARKGITLPGSSFRAEGLNEKDRTIYFQTNTIAWIRFAISYVRDAMEMSNYCRVMGEAERLIAKIERAPAVDDILHIANFCAALWLCRGDLGAELGLPGMARAAAQITRQAAALQKPLYLAGQVLEHMVTSPAPTRSEVCCIHETLAAGYRGVVLSDETAIGQYPVEAVQAAAMFREV